MILAPQSAVYQKRTLPSSDAISHCRCPGIVCALRVIARSNPKRSRARSLSDARATATASLRHRQAPAWQKANSARDPSGQREACAPAKRRPAHASWSGWDRFHARHTKIAAGRGARCGLCRRLLSRGQTPSPSSRAAPEKSIAYAKTMSAPSSAGVVNKIKQAHRRSNEVD
jgi:hypothetical protein